MDLYLPAQTKSTYLWQFTPDSAQLKIRTQVCSGPSTFNIYTTLLVCAEGLSANVPPIDVRQNALQTETVRVKGHRKILQPTGTPVQLR